MVRQWHRRAAQHNGGKERQDLNSERTEFPM